MILEWDDPFDATGPQPGDTARSTRTGTIPDDGSPVSFTFTGTADQQGLLQGRLHRPGGVGTTATAS